VSLKKNFNFNFSSGKKISLT